MSEYDTKPATKKAPAPLPRRGVPPLPKDWKPAMPARSAAPAEEEKKVAKHDQHDHAQGDTYDALRSSMKLAGVQIRSAAQAIDDAQKKSYGEAGIEPAFDIIQRQFDHVTSIAAHVTSLAKRLDPMITDQARITHMGEEFRAVWGAYRAFKDSVDRANNFATGKNHPLKANPEWVRIEIAGLNDRFGGQYKEAFGEANSGSGGGGHEAAQGSEAITNHLSAAAESAKSVRMGTDVDIGRLKAHVTEGRALIKTIESDKGALKKHKGEMAHVVAEFKAMLKERPVFEKSFSEIDAALADFGRLSK